MVKDFRHIRLQTQMHSHAFNSEFPICLWSMCADGGVGDGSSGGGALAVHRHRSLLVVFAMN